MATTSKIHTMYKVITTKVISAWKYIWTNKSKKKVWIPTAVVLITLLFSLFGGSKNTDIITYKVEGKEFVQNVSLTGKVISAKNVDMGFEVSGRINKVNYKVGDRVKKGVVIASLQNGDSLSNYQKSSAKLREVENGSRPEEVAIAQGDVVGAQNDADLSRQVLENELQNIYNRADEAIRFKVDNSFNNPRSVNPQFVYAIDRDSGLKDRLSSARIHVGETFSKWNGKYSIENINEVRGYIIEVQNFINDANTAMSIAAEKTNTSDSNYVTVQSNKTDIVSARTSFSAAVSTLNQAQISYKNSLNVLTRAKNNLTLKQSAGTQEQIDVQRADLQSAQAMISKTLIIAPFDGVITKVDVKEGEISSPNTPVISLLNDGEYQIETFVSENDIAKLKVSQTTTISLDAYGRDVFFDGIIISIDPAETIKDGVSTYRTKIQFVTKDERVKSGMTANIDIETDRRPNIVTIPQASIFLDKGVKKVYVLTDDSCLKNSTCAADYKKMKNVKEVEIKTGEINNNGDIEILSGLENNQTIIYGKK